MRLFDQFQYKLFLHISFSSATCLNIQGIQASGLACVSKN